MENGNFVIKTIFWTLILASFAWTTTVLFIGGSTANAIENRQLVADIKIQEEMKKSVDKQTDINQDILVALMEIKTDLKYLKEKR